MPDHLASLLFDVLQNPAVATGYSPSQWDQLMPLARRTGMFARLAVELDRRNLSDQMPPRVQEHLHAMRVVAVENERIVRWEVNRITCALVRVDCPVVLLKGAAYVMTNLPPARGRLVSDVDILVPKHRLRDIESALAHHGWEPVKLNPYDQRYYRKWMHELPPLRHRDRLTVIDVHHTILPESGRLHPDPQLLLASSRPLSKTNPPRTQPQTNSNLDAMQADSQTNAENAQISNIKEDRIIGAAMEPVHQEDLDKGRRVLPTSSLKPTSGTVSSLDSLVERPSRDAVGHATQNQVSQDHIRILSPVDMVLHTSVHLFQDGEVAGGLRDLCDINDHLLVFPGREPDFWDQLVPRATQLGLQRPLFYAVRYAQRLLGTPVPKSVEVALWDVGAPTREVVGLMDRLVERAMAPEGLDGSPVSHRLARWLLYVRSHWLRMPPHLLTVHLTRKALRHWLEKEEEPQPPPG